MNPIQTPRGKKTYSIDSLNSYKPAYRETYRDQYVPVLSEHQRAAFDSSHFDNYPYYLNVDSKGNRSIDQGQKKVSARYVFQTANILPYSIDKKDTRNLQTEIAMLSPVYNQKTPRVPILYRISDDFAIDDLGRIYSTGKNGRLYWRQYRLYGDLRNKFTLRNRDGSYLQQSAYFFAGIAGYNPSLQDTFAGSGRFDFHHVAENRLDLRPTAVFPLETYLHRTVHDDLTKVRGFFKWSKQFYV